MMRTSYRSNRNLLAGAAFTLCLLSLGACGNRNAPKPTTQVAAKVGSEEISLHQINAALAQANSRGASPAQIKELSRTTLEGLIDQQVAVDQALETKLNRDPEVIAQIEAARLGVLANAYVRQFVASLPKPDEGESKKYFADHPALFSERRIYTVQEIVAPRSPAVVEQLTSMAGANKSMDEVAAMLKARQVSFTPASTTRAAEQIPLDLLPRMHVLEDGHDLLFTAPTTVTILRLVASRTEPVPEAAALPRIAQYLGTQRTVDAITAHIKALRSKVSVVYLGEFAQPALGVNSTLEKGVAGLK